MKTRNWQRIRARLAAVTVAAAALTGSVLTSTTASAAPAGNRDFAIATSLTPGIAADRATALSITAAAAGRQVATVKVRDALLRSQPTTRSTKLDVSQPPRGVDIYCWHDYTDSSHFVWFRAHPWGSRFTGWMRADLLYRTGPLPPRC